MDPIDAPRRAMTPLAVAAFAVNVFTACGAACALLALLAAAGGDWPEMFLWLGLALVVDGIDGSLARRLRVAEVLPRWSGVILDLVVDILNYVLVPAYALVASRGLLPASIATLLGIVIVVSSALYFADRRMKTADHYFRGFPAVWNVVAFYLFVLTPPPWLGAIVIAALVALTFVPVHFIHPLRVPNWRLLTIAALVSWALLAFYAIVKGLDPGLWVKAILGLLAIYFVAIGFLHRRHP
ncbi:MAG: CDP-alcohol phosphatidyltransferase family protein [Xanthobacteraceae bacterium]